MLALVTSNGGNDLRGIARAEAREKLVALKKDLHAELTEAHRSESRLDSLERHFVEPALRRAQRCILIRSNTVPGSQWIPDLTRAKTAITEMVDKLKRLTD